MKILIACEFSGIVREAFRLRGHDAWSCDLLPTDIPGQHYQGDIFDILNNWDIIGGKPDIVIAHPDCTYLTNSGVCWLYHPDHADRWQKMLYASWFFKQLWNLDVEKICIENPIPHKYGRLPPYTQIIQPWQFGHGETKATCLWLRGLPLLKPSNIVSGRVGRVHHEPPGKDRWKNRSRTYQGIANAMSEQWNF